MKKVALICALIALTTASCVLFNQNKEEKFVNPVFYEKMISASHENFKVQ